MSVFAVAVSVSERISDIESSTPLHGRRSTDVLLRRRRRDRVAVDSESTQRPFDVNPIESFRFLILGHA